MGNVKSGQRFPPDVVLLEGINKSGKTDAARWIMEKYPNRFKYIKFPYFKENIDILIGLYKILDVVEEEREDENGKYHQYVLVNQEHEMILAAIHNTFDADFRQWSWDYQDEVEAGKGIVYLFDRYWPSNSVYSNLHGHFRNIYEQNHLVTPKLTCYFRVAESKQGYYEKLFPEPGSSTLDLQKQMLTPDILLHRAQSGYDKVLSDMLSEGKTEYCVVINALNDEATYEEFEQALNSKGLLY